MTMQSYAVKTKWQDGTESTTTFSSEGTARMTSNYRTGQGFPSEVVTVDPDPVEEVVALEDTPVDIDAEMANLHEDTDVVTLNASEHSFFHDAPATDVMFMEGEPSANLETADVLTDAGLDALVEDVVEEPAPIEVATSTIRDVYEKMNITELRKAGAKLKVKGGWTMKKPELIDAIVACFANG